MKSNYDHNINIDTLIMLEPVIKALVQDDSIWETLNIDYYPPIVERLYTIYGDFRIFLHVIHKPDSEVRCLYHKHRAAAAFKMLKGSYEMGITYSEEEISSDAAYNYPSIAKFIMSGGSYYEMTQTDSMHYVRPISKVSYSIMVTCGLYPEASFRKEALDRELFGLSDSTKYKYLREFRELLSL